MTESKRYRGRVRAAMVIAVSLVAASVSLQLAQAQTFEVLHTFSHLADGARPLATVAIDTDGNLYGTTAYGGEHERSCGLGCGTAFKFSSTGEQVWLHSFAISTGEIPDATLFRDAAGNLFGTTYYGGHLNCEGQDQGCGTVFELNGKTGKETLLYKFTGPPDGEDPDSLLVEDQAGNLYGTTWEGGTGCPGIGSSGCGTVFKLDSSGKETVLYSFSGGFDGCEPGPGVTLDSAGNIYGVTTYGGAGVCRMRGNYGVVFELDTAGNETVLHTFSGGTDGAYPMSVLLLDSQGNLYGTTAGGGSDGGGTVFKLDSSGNETVLYNFRGGSDGADPYAGVVEDAAGNFYGTTAGGGTYNLGTVFELSTAGVETVMHSFTGGTDGTEPFAGLTIDASGALYGTTYSGGDPNCHRGGRIGCGVVFKVTP